MADTTTKSTGAGNTAPKDEKTTESSSAPKTEEPKKREPTREELVAKVDKLEGMVTKLLQSKEQVTAEDESGNRITLEAMASSRPVLQDEKDKLTLEKATKLYEANATRKIPKNATPISFSVRGFPNKGPQFLVILLDNGQKLAVEYVGDK